MKLRSGRVTKTTKITKAKAIKKAPKKKPAPKPKVMKIKAPKPVKKSPPRAPLKRLERLDVLEEERKVEDEYIETIFPGLIAVNEKRERLSQQDTLINGVWY